MQSEKQPKRLVSLARRPRRGVCITPDITHNKGERPREAA